MLNQQPDYSVGKDLDAHTVNILNQSLAQIGPAIIPLVDKKYCMNVKRMIKSNKMMNIVNENLITRANFKNNDINIKTSYPLEESTINELYSLKNSNLKTSKAPHPSENKYYQKDANSLKNISGANVNTKQDSP